MPSTTEMQRAGKKAGLEVWRIENMEMVPVPSKQYGQFFSGDSYIVLRTYSSKGGKFQWDLHFWLGNESSQDERGAAAILSAQLDDFLGGFPVQYREIQNKESTSFRGYFKQGITYKLGGVQSGFKHVTTNVSDVKRLLHVKGRKSVRATEVEMHWKNFNKGDIFIVEVKNDIFQWNGSVSNRFERLKACELVHLIRDNEKGGKGTIHVINEDEEIPEEMMKALAGSPSDVGQEVVDEETITHERARLYHVSSDTGSLIVKDIAKAPFKQEMLDSGDCYILDNGSNGAIFVWKGKQASPDERSGAMKNAIKFIDDRGYHSSTKIQVMAEDAESILFTQFFKDWKRKDQTVGLGKTHKLEKIAKVEKAKFDVTTLYDKPKLAAQHRMVDDGSGKVEVWRVEGKELMPVDTKDFGHFFAGDSYVIQYTYTPKNRKEYVIYSWQGLDSTKDEIAASAFHSVHLHEKVDRRSAQCRVVQGKEPQHLLSIFKHPILISFGGYNKIAGKNMGTSKTALYQVRSTVSGGTKLIETKLSANMLNSNDTFLLKTPKQGYIWVGKGSIDLEVEAAQYGAKKLNISQNVKRFDEGKEPAEFWSLLGGKKEYASSLRLQEDLEVNPPRLFVISNAKGNMFVDEVPGEFTQSDLEPDDIMMLDCWDVVFIWIGEGANKEERNEAPSLVDEYIAHDPRGRDSTCPVITINMGSEPVTFTGFFPSWDSGFYEKRRNFTEIYQNL